jgi:CopG family transcriptional regulator / antitoxin EndoAI
MHRRLNISLPEETIRLLDQVAAKGDRSHVIAEAVTRYVAEIGRARLRKLMKERAVKRADLDVEIAAEWASSDRDAWERRKR